MTHYWLFQVAQHNSPSSARTLHIDQFAYANGQTDGWNTHKSLILINQRHFGRCFMVYYDVYKYVGVMRPEDPKSRASSRASNAAASRTPAFVCAPMCYHLCNSPFSAGVWNRPNSVHHNISDSIAMRSPLDGAYTHAHTCSHT